MGKAKQILFEEVGRGGMQRGINKLTDAVQATLGPKGRMAVIDHGGPKFTLDGVTVAREISLKDPAENFGAEIIKEAAEKTNEIAGDGTTTVSIICRWLVNGGLKGVAAGIDPILMKEGIEKAKTFVLERLQKMVRTVKTEKDIANVATISSREPEMGAVVARVFKQVGKDGVVAVEESKTIGIHEEVVQGMEIDRGMISPYFMTNAERRECVLEDPLILVTSQVISANEQIVNILQAVVNSTDKKTLLVVADEVSAEALATLIINKVKGIMKVAAVKSPGYGDNKKAMLEDIAILTGATHVSEEVGMKVDDCGLDVLGKADRVILTQHKTVIVGGKGKPAAIKGRVSALKKQMAAEESSYRRTTLEKRYSQMQGGVAVIRVGAFSEAETQEKHYRIEDAVNAAKSALHEGIVIGAGLALYRASNELQGQIEREKDLSVRYGMEVLRDAIRQPAMQVIENAGANASQIMEQIHQFREVGKVNSNCGWNAATGKHVGDMFEAGIIDPLRVERVAIEQAVSVTKNFLSTATVIVDEPEEDKPVKKS